MLEIKSDGIMDARKRAATALLETFDFGVHQITDSDTGWRGMFFDHWERVLFLGSGDAGHKLVMHLHFESNRSLIIDSYCMDLATGRFLAA